MDTLRPALQMTAAVERPHGNRHVICSILQFSSIPEAPGMLELGKGLCSCRETNYEKQMTPELLL